MAYARLPEITDAAMRDRLAGTVRRMRQEAAELAKLPDPPRRLKGTNRILAKAARVNIRQLQDHIAEWDAANKPAKGKRNGKSEGNGGGPLDVAGRPGSSDRVARAEEAGQAGAGRPRVRGARDARRTGRTKPKADEA